MDVTRRLFLRALPSGLIAAAIFPEELLDFKGRSQIAVPNFDSVGLAEMVEMTIQWLPNGMYDIRFSDDATASGEAAITGADGLVHRWRFDRPVAF